MKPFDLHPLLRHCQSELPAMLRCLRAAVEIESPTNSKAGVDRMAKFFARELRRLGGRVRILGHAKAGSSVCAEFFGGSVAALAQSNKPILILGHLDTVWSQGTLRRMPFRVRGARAYGPGILDMKSGIVQALWAVRALRALKIDPSSPVRFFLNADEEASSVAFRKQILAEARRARAALVVEPAAEGGALKTARKGVGEFRISVQGRAAHAGINPGAGASAIAELARQIIHIQSFPLAYRGMTLNVGVIEGGTRSNVVPEFASAAVDVRIQRPADGKAIERTMFRLRPFDPETRLEVTGGINRPPMERAQAGTLFQKARGLGSRLGMKLEEVATGGGSDGNFTAALGIPTLDGLGGVGDGAHARSEHVVIRQLPRRAALLAALIATL